MPKIYIYMPDEAVDTWRPVEASIENGANYRIANTPSPPDEVWEFPPGSVVRCEWRQLEDGPALVAVALA